MTKSTRSAVTPTMPIVATITPAMAICTVRLLPIRSSSLPPRNAPGMANTVRMMPKMPSVMVAPAEGRRGIDAAEGDDRRQPVVVEHEGDQVGERIAVVAELADRRHQRACRPASRTPAAAGAGPSPWSGVNRNIGSTKTASHSAEAGPVSRSSDVARIGAERELGREHDAERDQPADIAQPPAEAATASPCARAARCWAAARC